MQLAALITVLATIVLLASPVESRTWYVRPDGGGDAPTIQAAIDSSQSGDVVLLAAGTYDAASEGSSGLTLLYLKPGIVLRGAGGAAGTSIVATYRAIRLVETGEDTRIEGLTITGRTPYWDTERRGAGLYILGSGTTTIARCAFINCGVTGETSPPGGAIACDPEIRPTIIDCIFENNSSPRGQGGAIFCNEGKIRRCQFTGNWAARGGGAIFSAAASIDSCDFRNNSSGGDPGGGGGAIVTSFGSITNCRFENNSAGGLYSGNGGAVAGASYVADCLFLNNRTCVTVGGGQGGAVRLADGGTVIRCTFVDNRAQFGGAIFMQAGTVSECIFLGNSATWSQCGPWEASGGGIRATGPTLIESSTFIANTCDPPTNPGAISTTSTVTVRRCIIARTGGIVCEAGAMAEWSCCDLFGNDHGDSIGGTDAGGNFSSDPRFCDPDPGTSLNFTLQAGSPCAPGQHPDGIFCGLIGAAAVGCPAVSVEATTWSRFKSFFR